MPTLADYLPKEQTKPKTKQVLADYIPAQAKPPYQEPDFSGLNFADMGGAMSQEELGMYDVAGARPPVADPSTPVPAAEMREMPSPYPSTAMAGSHGLIKGAGRLAATAGGLFARITGNQELMSKSQELREGIKELKYPTDDNSKLMKYINRGVELSVEHGTEMAVEYAALSRLWGLLKIPKVLNAAGTILSRPFIPKALAVAAQTGKLAKLSAPTLKTLGKKWLAAFLQHAPENAGFLATWSGLKAVGEGGSPAEIAESAVSGAKWGLGFAAASPALKAAFVAIAKRFPVFARGLEAEFSRAKTKSQKDTLRSDIEKIKAEVRKTGEVPEWAREKYAYGKKAKPAPQAPVTEPTKIIAPEDRIAGLTAVKGGEALAVSKPSVAPVKHKPPSVAPKAEIAKQAAQPPADESPVTEPSKAKPEKKAGKKKPASQLIRLQGRYQKIMEDSVVVGKDNIIKKVDTKRLEDAAKKLKLLIKKEAEYDYPDGLSIRAEAVLEADLLDVDDNLKGIKKIKPSDVGKNYEDVLDSIYGRRKDLESGFPVGANIRKIQVEMEPTGKPMKARDILNYLSRAFGVPIRGKATHKMRMMAGFYHTKHRGIRLKRMLEIGTATHEIAHHLDWWINKRLSKNPPKGTADELVKLGKELYGKRKPPGGYKSEGFAEFIRILLTDDIVQEKAPNFYKYWTEQYMPKHPVETKVLNNAKKMIDRWRQQGAEARIESQISRKPIKGPVKTRITKAMGEVQRAMINRVSVLDRQLREVGIETDPTIEGGLEPTKNPVELALRFGSKEAGITRAFCLIHTTDIWGKPNGKCLADVLLPIENKLETFFHWNYARLALMRWGQGKNPGISKVDAQYVFDKYDNKEWRNISDEITKWNHRVLDYVVESGAMPASLAAKIKKKNPVYMPLLRAFEEGEVQRRGGAGRGYVETGKAIKTMKGSGREVMEFIESMVTQSLRMISIANKTMVAKSLADLTKTYPGLAGVIWKVPPPMKVTKVKVTDALEKLVKYYGLEYTDIGEINESDSLAFFTADRKYWGKDNIVPIVRGDKVEFYETSPEIYRVLKGLDIYQLPWFLNLTMGKAARMVRLGATGLNPGFGLIRNFIRDGLTAFLTAEHARLGPISSAKGVISDIRDTEMARLFKSMGGQMVGQIGFDRISTQKLRSEIVSQSGKRWVVHTVFHPIQAARELFGVSELGPRIAEFEEALKWGENKWGKGSINALTYAFNAAQDVTLNFTRGGDIGRILNAIIPFFNAAIQDVSKIYRTFRKHPARTMFLGLTGFTIPTLWLWWKNKDEEWYKNLADWEKSEYWHFKLPGVDRIVRIPKPFTFGYMFASLPESYADSKHREDPKVFTEAIKYAAEKTAPPVVPALVGPIIEVYGNKDYSGRPIVPASMERKLAADQYKPYTTALMKLIGRELKLSPVVMEHLADGYTGGLYNRIARTMELMKKQIKGKPEGVVPSDWPVIGTLFLRDPEAPRRQTERFYYELEQLRKLKGSKKITPRENVRRMRYERASRALSTYWKKLAKSPKPDARKKTYRQIKRVIELTMRK